MAVTAFKPITWAPNEVVSESKMDQFANNIQWLKENKMDGLYTLPGGTKRYAGVKVCGGRALIPPAPKSDTQKVTVRFANFFTSRCQPIVTTGVMSNHIRTFCVINGINGLIPDNTGFEIQVVNFTEAKKKANITKSFYVNWIAVGY